MPQQMKFDIPARTALGRGDFYVTESNSVALGLVDTWPAWPSGKLLLVGPHGAGKTHLAHVWCKESKMQGPVGKLNKSQHKQAGKSTVLHGRFEEQH